MVAPRSVVAGAVVERCRDACRESVIFVGLNVWDVRTGEPRPLTFDGNT